MKCAGLRTRVSLSHCWIIQSRTVEVCLPFLLLPKCFFFTVLMLCTWFWHYTITLLHLWWWSLTLMPFLVLCSAELKLTVEMLIKKQRNRRLNWKYFVTTIQNFVFITSVQYRIRFYVLYPSIFKSEKLSKAVKGSVSLAPSAQGELILVKRNNPVFLNQTWYNILAEPNFRSERWQGQHSHLTDFLFI